MVQGIGDPSSLARNISRQYAQKAFRTAQKSDLDGDGKITRDEFVGREEAFNALDADSDGAITGADFEKMFTSKTDDDRTVSQIEELLGGFVKARDKDEDGYLSLQEYGGDKEAFKRLDSDQDGRLSTRELAEDLFDTLQTAQARMTELLSAFDRNKDETDWADRIREDLRKQFEDFVRSRDEDGNGRLSADELGEAQDLLEYMDADENGELDAGEITNYIFDTMNGDRIDIGWDAFKNIVTLLSKRDESNLPGSNFDTRA
ncbi:MAG: EF-hand domain-containing protein [bacterium]